MEKAFSLIKHKLFTASSAEYRQNLDEQLVCPTCYEQVFKKKLWVASKESHTHFFSHYFGEQDSCEQRTKGENNYENSADHHTQLQRIEVFNKYFRDNIINALVKIIGKQASNRLSSALDYSERICIKEIENTGLEKLGEILIHALDDPITYSINEKLKELEEALLAIYWHLRSPHGQSNLRFITCVSLLLSFHREREHLEDILERKFLKSKSNLNSLLLGNAVLLLANSEYVDWNGSTKPILDFIAPPVQTAPAKKVQKKIKSTVTPKETDGYFACIYCKKIHFFEFNKYKECNSCKRWFYTDPQNTLKNYKASDEPQINQPIEKSSSEETKTSARWIYCINCNKQYFSENITACPHRPKSGQIIPMLKEDKKKLAHCSKCKANYIGIKGSCPYCSENPLSKLKNCRSCGKGLIKSALLPSKAGQAWRKCNFCNLNFEFKNF